MLLVPSAQDPFTGPADYQVLAAKSSLCTFLRLVPTLLLAKGSWPPPGDALEVTLPLHGQWLAKVGGTTSMIQGVLQSSSWIRLRPTSSWIHISSAFLLLPSPFPPLPSRLLLRTCPQQLTCTRITSQALFLGNWSMTVPMDCPCLPSISWFILQNITWKVTLKGSGDSLSTVLPWCKQTKEL